MARAKPRRAKEKPHMDEVMEKAEAIGVPAAQLARGGYEIADIRLDDGEKVTTHRTLINRGGTAIERWLHEPGSKLFGETEKSAVRYCQALWQRIDQKGPPNTVVAAGRFVWTGQSEHEALAELALLKARLPSKYWNVYENVCRFDMGAPDAGIGLANSSRTANDAAKACVAFVAGMIAQWRGL